MPDRAELKTVNEAVRKYATEGDEYDNRDLIDAMYSLHDTINREIFRGQLDPPIISVDTDGHTQKDGYYSFYRNEAGLSHNIQLAAGTSGVALVNALLHQTIHQFAAQTTVASDGTIQEHKGFHNASFRSQMLNLGIYINNNGDVIGMAPQYAETLKKLGLEFMVDEELSLKKPKEGEEGYEPPPPREIKRVGSGRMKAYVCDCKTDNKAYFTNDGTPAKWTCNVCGKTPHQA